MKAITVKFRGHTETKPARYIAKDSDGNRAESRESYPDAAIALCKKMGWTGELVSGGGADNAEVFVWLGGPVWQVTK